MSLVPAFEIGIWNTWILQVIFFLTLSTPDFFMSKEGKGKNKRATQQMPLSKVQRIMGSSTHTVLWPLSVIYSIFVPLKIGTAWLYVGLIFYALALVMFVMPNHHFATTLLGQPVTKGIYRISRHPIYLGGFVLFIGMGIACASWVFILCGIIWIALWSVAVPAEERFLLEKYGDSYREYMKRTPRWLGIPKTG